MVPSSSPRPQPKQTRSTGWIWPHLVDAQVQNDRATQVKRKTASPAQTSTTPSLHNLQNPSDLYALRETQSTSTSPTHNPGDPGQGKLTGHRAETSEYLNAVDDESQNVNNVPQDTPFPDEPANGPKIQPQERGKQTVDDAIRENTDNAKLPDGSPIDSSPAPAPPAAVGSHSGPFSASEQAGLLPEPAVPKKPSPPPIITIQRPSSGDVSESEEGEIPAAPLPMPEPRTMDSALSESRSRTEEPLLRELLDEGRHVTPELTEQDRERTLQDIASDMAAVPTGPTETEKLTRPSDTKIKRRMKIRSACVRGPVLKLLLGRQLAGPTKDALRMYALGKAVPPEVLPAIPDCVNAGV